MDIKDSRWWRGGGRRWKIEARGGVASGYVAKRWTEVVNFQRRMGAIRPCEMDVQDAGYCLSFFLITVAFCPGLMKGFIIISFEAVDNPSSSSTVVAVLAWILVAANHGQRTPSKRSRSDMLVVVVERAVHIHHVPAISSSLTLFSPPTHGPVLATFLLHEP